MFTICTFLFAMGGSGFVSAAPLSSSCVQADRSVAEKAVAECRASKDPLQTCDAVRKGALVWDIRWVRL